jgi:Zn ribbon nucleic-acid-binding protein
MGSVIDFIECPNCTQEAYSDFYYKTGEQYVNCSNCGYVHSQFWKRNEEGKLETLDGTDNYEFDNLTLVVEELKNPYGSYRLKTYQSPAYQVGSFETEDQYNEFKSNLTEDVEIEVCTVSRFIDGEIKIETLVDNKPKVDSDSFTQEDYFL